MRIVSVARSEFVLLRYKDEKKDVYPRASDGSARRRNDFLCD